jgi:hypothetical protein
MLLGAVELKTSLSPFGQKKNNDTYQDKTRSVHAELVEA